FLVLDGVLPSNEGRGYVLRRVMRRGMRHAHIMGAQDPLMYKLFPTLLGKMGEAYPELKRAGALIVQILESEEKRFKMTLDRGLKMLDEETDRLGSGEKFPGDVAFKLYDTFGFPLDLTQDALRAKNIEVDTTNFDACMAEQKARARAAWSGSGDAANEKVWFDIVDEFGASEFLGYKKDSAEGKILALVKDGVRVQELKAGEEGYIITNQTPFYGESGGQVGDNGVIHTLGEAPIKVIVQDTKKLVGKLIAHAVKCDTGGVRVGQGVQLSVDADRRAAIKANHSVTHLMHEALRRVLGDHVAQKGSLQDAQRTRFDISHPKGISREELDKVEELVNAQVKAGGVVETRLMALEDARDAGAMALFGEKYDDEVRVVSMGRTEGNRVFSIELCGGTHVKDINEIECFKIVSEGALSSGVRRLEAITGERVDAYLQNKDNEAKAEIERLSGEYARLMDELKSLDGSYDSTPSSADEYIQANKRLSKLIGDLRRSQAAESAGADEAKEIGGVKFIGKVLDGFPPKDLKPMADDLKAKLGSGVIVLVATNDGKASIVVGVTDDLTSRFSAVDLVRVGSEALGGKGGGGRPDMAQAGGPDAGAANDGVLAIEKALQG
nr:alanine--tRNA ligase [Micavibrio sp.]